MGLDVANFRAGGARFVRTSTGPNTRLANQAVGGDGMLRNLAFGVVIGTIGLTGVIGVADAQPIGEPSGTFDITIAQGGNIVAQDTVTIGPGGDLVDLKATWQDGDAEDFTQIGAVSSVTGTSPIILKVTTGDDPLFRLSNWYINMPASLADINSPGVDSLFDPNGGLVDVTITGLTFENGAAAVPYVVDNDTFGTSYMRDFEGHFYELPESNPAGAWGHGSYDIQVPGQSYLDDPLTSYNFNVIETGQTVSWSWSQIIVPDLVTTVHDGTSGGVTPLIPGYVFELGLAVAFVPMPEPGTLGLMIVGLGTLTLRRRRR